MAGVNLPGESGQLGVASDLSLNEEDDDTMENFLDKGHLSMHLRILIKL